MVDLTTLNPFQRGQSPQIDSRQLVKASDRQADPNAAKSDKNSRQIVDPVDLSTDAVAAKASDDKAVQTSAAKPPATEELSTKDLFERALNAALELIKDDVIEMFRLSGMDGREAMLATDALFEGIRGMFSDDGNVDFNFQQAVAKYSRTEIAYAGSKGAGAAVSESAMMGVQSLNININSTTGEFLFDFKTAKVEVVTTKAVAIGDSTAGVMGAIDSMMDGLKNNNLVDMLGNPTSADKGGLMFDMNDGGVAEFIRQLMADTTGTQTAAATPDEKTDAASGADDAAMMAELIQSRMAKLNAQIMEQAGAIVRGISQSTAPDGSGNKMLNLSVDMILPMGIFGQNENGATFQFPKGETVAVADPSQEQDVLA
ncbi:hypothetical protein [Thalassospira xiamenensis]|uniref:Uncharacterized protein n=1 Tax=Thalassospira xiamenensis TaxID=220697 RepID=A0A367XKY3_9PROT|nr:hypothetical protein [Thalassospira xiamenensis]MCK2167984.1 hypothetical protein [Thalassospira xiamenensis]RCK53392.1 hypothetical protein TH44_04205 [Thalassospira xiamenensis]